MNYDERNPPPIDNNVVRGNFKRKMPAFEFIRADELIADLSPPPWILPGYLQQGVIAELFGEWESGKSLLAIDMACRVALGVSWREEPVERAAVMYLCGEGAIGVKQRMRAWQDAHGESLAGADLFVSRMAAALCHEESAQAVRESIEALSVKPALIIIDTRFTNFGGDENHGMDMAGFINNLLNYLIEPFGSTVLVVHHTGHANKDRSRGHSSWNGAARVSYKAERNEQDGLVRMRCTMSNDHEKPEPLAWSIESHELGINDRNGNSVTAPILTPEEWSEPPEAGPVDDGARPKGKSQQKALAQLIELYKQHEQRIEDGGLTTQARVTMSDWKDQCLQAGIPKRSFYDAKDALLLQGYVEIDGTFAVLTKKAVR